MEKTFVSVNRCERKQGVPPHLRRRHRWVDPSFLQIGAPPRGRRRLLIETGQGHLGRRTSVRTEKIRSTYQGRSGWTVYLRLRGEASPSIGGGFQGVGVPPRARRRRDVLDRRVGQAPVNLHGGGEDAMAAWTWGLTSGGPPRTWRRQRDAGRNADLLRRTSTHVEKTAVRSKSRRAQ